MIASGLTHLLKLVPLVLHIEVCPLKIAPLCYQHLGAIPLIICLCILDTGFLRIILV